MNLDPRVKNIIIAVLGVLTLFLLIQSVAGIYKIKESRNTYPTNIISVRGTGEVVGTPDVATFSFTVREKGKDEATAKNLMSIKANKAIDFLKQQGIEVKDIKTENYYSNPVYTYPSGPVIYSGDPVITGYEVAQTVSVKVRKIDDAGKILSGIANLKIGEVGSLGFAIDDLDSLKNEAKKLAIEKAKAEAKTIAKNLDVDLERVTGYYEEIPYDPGMGYGGEMNMMAIKDQSVSPNLQVGQQKITISVSISYEIGN